MKISDCIKKGIELGLDVLDCQLLLACAIGVDKSFIIMNPEKDVDFGNYFDLLQLRADSKPVQQIIGKCEFFGLEFEVNENVLIPRADTEVLVEEVIKKAKAGAKILEIGTGSGCIAISLAKNIKNAEVSAVDISIAALDVAKRNAAANSVDIEFIQADIFEWEPKEKYDIIVSNPPYISTLDILDLEPNVRDYEPHLALDGGDDGLKFYRRIAELEADVFAFEVGVGQAGDVVAMFKECKSEIYKDLAGIMRAVVVTKL